MKPGLLAISLSVFILGCSDKAEQALGITEYTCEGSNKIEVSYAFSNAGQGTAMFYLNGKAYQLLQIRAASGAKYAEDNVIWWAKGDSGFLQIDDHTVLKDCTAN